MSTILKIERYIEKQRKRCKWRSISMHNYIYVSYSFRGHEKDLFHLNKIIPYVLYIYIYITVIIVSGFRTIREHFFIAT